MNYEIKKGVPIPPDRRGRKTGYLTALRSMEIGDSIHGLSKSVLSSHSSAARVGVRITTRRMPNGTYSIWRIA